VTFFLAEKWSQKRVKRSVEVAIEKNEDAAIKWLQEQTKEVGF
jgi:hypothetical protein